MNNIPKGYKLVPVEPTKEMIYAIATGAHRGDAGKEIWSEALAYAADATPPQPIFDEDKERELFEAQLEPHMRKLNDYGNYLVYLTEHQWIGWKACAQSRAKAVEVSDE